MVANPLVVGLTGSFGSGCSSLAAALRSEQYGFSSFSLSQPLKDRWATEKNGDPKRAPRGELQDMGNAFAGSQGPHVLAELAWRAAKKAKSPRVVFDGIKREAEVRFFREQCASFCLIAVQCGRDERWKRAADTYHAQGLTDKDFERDDMRDQIEEVPYGQQVSLCVDDADIVVNNNAHFSKTAAVSALQQRVERYVGLLRRQPLSGPSADEIAMAMAYAQAEASECIKRHVGAVIVDQDGRLVSVGFNQNPLSMRACHEQYGHCRKDDLMARRLEELEGTFCPDCGQPLNSLGAPFRCPGCGLSLKGHYFADHGVRWCPALHAEERAIGLARGTDLRGCSLYATTFPCLNCAKLIADAGIRRLIYVEPYPEKESVALLENSVEVVPFEGVKARAFHTLYKPYRAVMEDRYRLDSM